MLFRSCAMKAVLGLDREPLEQCCEKVSVKGSVQIANYNCPGQIVIAGEKAAVEAAAELAAAEGAKRCVALPVSGPFHTAFMEPAGLVLKEIFAETAFGEMQFPVLFNAF